MSIRLMSLVFDAEIEDLNWKDDDSKDRKAKASTVKLMLLAYADHANDEGEGSYPGYRRLERKTALSRQGIADTLEAIKQNNFMTFQGWSKLDTHEYSLNKTLLESLVKPLDSRESSHLTPSSQATRTKPSSTSFTNGASAVNSLEWKIAHGEPVTEEDLKAASLQKKKNIADLIASSGFGVNATLAYDIALAFMVTRDIEIVRSKVKGQRKAIVSMIEQGVTAEDVKQATAKLMEAGLTVTDLYSVEKTAVDIANQPKPKPVKIFRAEDQPEKQAELPAWVLQKQAEIHARGEGLKK